MTQTLSVTPTAATRNNGVAELMNASTCRVGDIAKACAQRVAEGFVQYEDCFRAVTRNAPLRFQQCDWQNSQQDAMDRDRLYDVFVERTLTNFEQAADGRALEPAFWQEVRQDFARLTEGLHDGGLRRTFFNSVFKRCFDSDSVMPRCGFVPINYSDLINKEVPDARRQFACREATVAALSELLKSLPIEADWQNVHAIAIHLGGQIESHWLRSTKDSLQFIEVLDTVFYRFTRAFVFGRLIGDQDSIPFALALTNPEGGVVVDNLLLGEADVSELFRRPHADFQVELEQVTDTVIYLRFLTGTLQHRDLFACLGHLAE